MKDEKKLIHRECETGKERENTMTPPLSNTYSDIKESEQVRKSRMNYKKKNLNERDRKEEAQ